ncbi:MAG TPA: OmpA family protein, partial [Gammaproteobacteria bacterium]
MTKRNHLWWLSMWLLSAGAEAQLLPEPTRGEAVERHLPGDQTFMQWVHDPAALGTQDGDRFEVREVASEELETVKLTNLVPPIHFESGVAEIPDSTVAELREILESMRDRRNVRLHLVGHADTQPLSPALAAIFVDNEGLSRERAGEVAEFLQVTLALPPDAISYEWAGDTRPIAPNETLEGRALNRRVEVEVWYDEVEEGVALEEVLVEEEFRRIKVCRIQTVCRLRYVEGRERRTRVQNLVAPLYFSAETIDVAPPFIEQIGQALRNMSDRQNVLVKFIGYTDERPLSERDERIYGTHVGLSKARSRRVALAVQEALGLPTATIDSDGRGSARPLGSNETEQGRALNRRVEVEFWYDDPLQELPGEPQICPAPGTEIVTRVYDPPWGEIPQLEIANGQPVIPPGYTGLLERALGDVADRTNARLRFVGYTSNETLERRTALVYGDDIGLSAARARRAMETVGAALELGAAELEFEGRGYVHSGDVVNAGFVQGETSHVVVQVVYDEVAELDDYDGVEITPITRELSAENAFGLNLMRITVDGDPIDDPARSSADIQRCTDVALERADIQFGFDTLEADRRLSVAAQPATVALRPGRPESPAATVRFTMYANYSHFIESAEVRIFDREQSLEATPLAIAAVGPEGFAEWQPDAGSFAAPAQELKYVLRAYGEGGSFDETVPQPLWLVYADEQEEGEPLAPSIIAPDFAPAPATLPEAAPEGAPDALPDGDPAPAPPPRAPDDSLLIAYGESSLGLSNIPLASGTVTVRGSAIPAGHTVYVAGRPVPIDAGGNFVAEEILPSGIHTVEVAVLDEAGNGDLFLRDLELERKDWFYVGMADVTLTQNDTNGPIDLLQGEDATYDYDSSADARLAFYVNGKFGDRWRLTASADTRDGPLEDLFSNFLNKSPDSLFRRIDPDYHFPTFGDDGLVEEMAPTLGKFYVRVGHGENYGEWGNFKIGYMNNELAQVDRGLYGANLHYQSERTTSFGERRFAIDGFTAEPGTLASFEEFRGTGGSLYFLHRQDLLTGSERVRIELRDRASGLVTGVVNLTPAIDYDIDYLQGRILLTEPLTSTAEDDLLVRSAALTGDEAYLVVRYEYTPGFEELDALSVGGQA